MQTLLSIVDLFLHLDTHLANFTQDYGALAYGLLFLVVFCETGLVVTPFLPGDSLLFVAGGLAAIGALNLPTILALLFIAAVIGDAVNYTVGHYVGPRVFNLPENNFWRKYVFKPAYLKRTQEFYVRYGGKTIVLARFVPIVRTFAPFLAGVGTMTYRKFAFYNVLGAAIWVLLFVCGGYFFSSIAIVKKNFSLVILAIIFVSILPIVLEFIRAKREQRTAN